MALMDDSVAGLIFRKRYGAVHDTSDSRVAQPQESPETEEKMRRVSAESGGSGDGSRVGSGGGGGAVPAPQVLSHTEAARKLLFFERLFYELDEDCSLFLSASECDLLLSYTLLDVDAESRKRIFHDYDLVHVRASPAPMHARV